MLKKYSLHFRTLSYIIKINIIGKIIIQTTYKFFRNDQLVVNQDFDPVDCTCLDAFDYKYFGRVLNLLEPHIRDLGLVIYVTGWTVHELPTYAPNVIVFILQDEWSRETKYRHKVSMVFRTCGLSPIRPEAFGYGGPSDMIANILGQLKAVFRDGGGRTGTIHSRLSGKNIAPVYNLPLGCYAYENVPMISMHARTNDLFFAGSVQHKKDAFFKRPKEIARQRMAKALDALAQKFPAIHILTTMTASFKDSITSSNFRYLDQMMNTKICPIPRGANLETFRFYEAIRYGCIPIGEAFPDNEFYKNAPILRLNKWADLETLLPDLLKNKDQLEELHKKSLKWWKDVCSEQAAADFILKKIKEKFV